MGVADAQLKNVAPNIDRFGERDLGFMSAAQVSGNDDVRGGGKGGGTGDDGGSTKTTGSVFDSNATPFKRARRIALGR